MTLSSVKDGPPPCRDFPSSVKVHVRYPYPPTTLASVSTRVGQLDTSPQATMNLNHSTTQAFNCCVRAYYRMCREVRMKGKEEIQGWQWDQLWLTVFLWNRLTCWILQLTIQS